MMEKTWKPELRKHIGLKVRELRKKRSISQDYLAHLLGVSQAWLSYVEKGEGSLTAEQFLEVLKIFNEVPQAFDLAKRDPDSELQRALVRLGADHLFSDPRVLPTRLNQDVEATIREVLLDSRNSRQMAAIAPVLARNFGTVDLKRLWATFVDYRLQNRLGWILENVAEAIGMLTPRLGRHDASPLRRAETTIRHFLAVREPEGAEWFTRITISKAGQESNSERDEALSHLDVLGSKPLSWISVNELWASAEPPSKRWGVVSALTIQDFYDALKAGLNLRETGDNVGPA